MEQMDKVGKGTKKFFGEFKDFISKGNVIDMAVGVVIGGAFSKIVNSLVENIITPLISAIVGKETFTDISFKLGSTTIGVGAFIQSIFDFLIMAFVIFVVIKNMSKLKSMIIKEEEVIEEATTKICPYCKTEINIEATRCPNCTSELD